MRFRPCIDIHNGKVKQIVGGSLKDEGNQASTNFTSELDAAWYARQYQKDHLKGGHIILLNPVGSEYYEATKKQAMGALAAYPGGMQIGGGITADNAQEYLDSGASHVIVTSYVFQDGIFHEERLQKLVNAVGKEHVVLDLSCRRKDGKFYVVTDRSAEPTPFGEPSCLFYVFTNRSTNRTTSGGSIFRCTTKDRGERRAKGLQSRPLDSGFLYGGMMPDVRTWYVFASVQFTRFRLVRWRAVSFSFLRLRQKQTLPLCNALCGCKHCFRRTLAYCSNCG